MKSITPEQVEQLKKRLPEEAVSQHPTKSYLSSIKAIYMTERLNEVFGVGSWSIKTKLECNAGEGMIVVHVTLEIPEYGIYYECFGGNDNGGENNKNFDLGDAYKGATTDAISKICSYMYIGSDVYKGIQKAGQKTTKTVETPTGGIKTKYYSSKTEECPECGTINEGKKFTKKDGTEAEGATCTDCGIKYFINR